MAVKLDKFNFPDLFIRLVMRSVSLLLLLFLVMELSLHFFFLRENFVRVILYHLYCSLLVWLVCLLLYFVIIGIKCGRVLVLGMVALI